jgi:tRNA pseudouridine(55) synthase
MEKLYQNQAVFIRYDSEMEEVIKLYKNIGETPLECIGRFRDDNPEYKNVKMTYLGRLDPMAEGLLLVLAGNTKRKNDYLEMDKTYEFEVIWGFETDTYDILGKVVERNKQPVNLEKKMEGLLKDIQKKKVQEYPPYSSRTVEGKPLFQWARENKIEEIEIPTRGIKIFSIEHIDTRILNGKDLLSEIYAKIDLVKGDFRQDEIKHIWRLQLFPEDRVYLSSFKADVSTGTYIRGLAHEMGGMLSCGGLALSIKRTRMGKIDI